MMTFLLFAPASAKWLGWRKDRKSRRDRLGRFWTFILQSYFDTLLRYVLSVTLCGAVVLKVMDQKTLVKRRWSYKVRITVYIQTLGEFARHEFTNLWLERHSFSVFDLNTTQPQTSKTSKSTASLLLAKQRTITEIRRQSNSVLCWLIPYSQMSFCYTV